MNVEETAHQPEANPAVGPDAQSESISAQTLQPSDTYSLIDELSDGLPSPSVEQPEPLSEATAAAEPPFTGLHRRYLLDRAVDLDLAWREGVRSLTEDEAQRSVGNNRITGTALGFFYGRVPSRYARVQLDDREANGKKTCAPAGVTPPPYIPSTVSEDGAEPLFIVEAPAKALAMASNGFSNTIGCGGIYAGVFEKGTCKFQAALLPFLRPTRAVYILFDAGRLTNPSVAHAEARLARGLLDHGCPTWIVELPGPEHGGDGPDDFLKLRGATAMQDLVVRARPAEPAAWAQALANEGAAVARQSLGHLPFVAAVAAGGPAALDVVASVLRSFATKAEIRAASKQLGASMQSKRAAKEMTTGNGGSEESVTSNAPILKRGDEVELAQEHHRQIGEHVVFAEGQTYVYRLGFWKTLPAFKQRTALGTTFAGALVSGNGEPRPLSLSDQKIRGALSHFEDLAACPEFFVSAARGLCFTNGFLRLGSDGVEFGEHDHAHRARHRYPFAYERDASCPKWARYLETTWEGDPDRADKISALQEFVGATLFGIMPRYKTALMLFGEADSGKSTCLTVLRGLVPAGAASAVCLHDFGHEYNRAHLAGKLLNLVAEVPATELVRSEAFKAIIAGDVVMGRNVMEKPFDFTPIAAHVFAANTLPHVNDRSEGVWTRWLVLTFNRRFLKANRGAGGATVGLAESILEDEIPGVVSWAVQGLERLLANAGAFTRPASGERVLAEWRRESNPVALFFDADLALDPAASASTGDLYRMYRAWCEANGFGKPLSHPSFGKMFTALMRERTGRADVTKVVHGSTIFVGVGAKDPAPKAVDYARVYS